MCFYKLSLPQKLPGSCFLVSTYKRSHVYLETRKTKTARQFPRQSKSKSNAAVVMQQSRRKIKRHTWETAGRLILKYQQIIWARSFLAPLYFLRARSPLLQVPLDDYLGGCHIFNFHWPLAVFLIVPMWPMCTRLPFRVIYICLFRKTYFYGAQMKLFLFALPKGG